MLVFLEQIGVGLLGILLYTVFKFQKHLRKPEIRNSDFWNKVWQESKFSLLWTIVMLVLISAIIKITPDVAPSIEALTAIQIGNNLAAFFTIGLGLVSLTDTKTVK